MSKEEEICQRYFAISKKMPKDVKRHCGICRQHGILVETRGHHCSRKNCNCSRCLLIRQRRQIMSTQIRIRRAQDKIFQRTSELTQATIIPENYRERNEQATYDLRQATKTDMASKNQCYICQKCKNHGVLVWKKEHKRYCLYANCTCDQCELIEKRRKLDQILKCSKFKPNERRKERLPYPSTSMNSSDCSSMLSALADLNKQLIRQTYQLTVKMPFSQLNSSSYPLLISNSSSSSQTNISMESTGKSDMSQNALVYPVPLRPQSLLLPNAITNMPMLYTMRSPIDEFLNTFATMQFTFGIF